MCWVRRVALGCWAIASLSAPVALAAEPPPAAAAAALAPSAASAPPTYALAWVRAEGAEDCPNGHALSSEVERRLGRAVFDVAAERSIEVEVTRFGNVYRSDVYVRDAAGHAVGHRQLQSDEPGCSALVNATALAIALVIDPEAASRPPAPPKAAAAFEPPPPVPAPPATPPPAPPPATVPPVTMVAAPPQPPAPTPPRTPVTLSARAQVVTGLVPATSPGFELSFSARPGQRWGYVFAASLARSQTVTRGIGSLDVGLSRVSGLVTFDAAGSEKVRLLFGAGPSVGAFHVAVRAPAPVTDSGDFWFLSAELAADLQVAVTDGFFFELGGSGVLPLRRQEFLIRGQSDPVWRQPLVSGTGFVGVGALFP